MNTENSPRFEITFWKRLQDALREGAGNRENGKRFALCFLGFAASFLLLVSGVLFLEPFFYFALMALFVCWHRANRLFLRMFALPAELYLLVFLGVGLLEWGALGGAEVTAKGVHFSPLLLVSHWLNLLVLVWAGGLFLQQENRGRFGVIVAYWLVLLVAHKGIFPGQPYNTILLAIFLFLILLKRTRWLEALSRVELILYFFVALVLFLKVHQPAYFDAVRWADAVRSTRLADYSLPKFLFYVARTYLLVLLVRIPLVLIYNFSPISRKLRIATFFQATIPQFIQLVVLLFIFYLFISGWQANLLRQSVEETVRRLPARVDSTLHIRTISRAKLDSLKSPSGTFIQEWKNFFYWQDTTAGRLVTYLGLLPQDSLHADSAYLVRINRQFLQHIFRENQFILGSGVAAFRYRPNPVMIHLYRLSFWQAGPFRINPVGIINPFLTRSESSRLLASVPRPVNGLAGWGTSGNLLNLPIVVGRIFLPTGRQDEYFTLNVFYNLEELSRWNFMTQILVVLVVLFLLLNALVIRRMVRFGKEINRLIVEKFHRLRTGVEEVASGNLNYQMQIPGNDEFSQFAGHFNRMARQLQKFMEEAKEKERLDQELKIAHRVQLEMLPERLPEIPGYRIAADMITANEVGGDFYDVFPLDEQCYFVAIGDVSGKGMSAAFYMAQLISLMRFATRFTRDLPEITLRLNEYLKRHVLDANIFVTGIFGILDTAGHRFRFIRAGHNLPMVVSPGASEPLREVRTPGLALGMTSRADFFRRHTREHTLLLNPGDMLVLYTDGYPEASRKQEGKDVLYGEERFREQIQQCATREPGEFIHCLKTDLERFYQNAPRFDDQTLLVIRREST